MGEKRRYHLYMLGADGHLVNPPVEAMCDNDQAAIEHAQQLRDRHAIEIWELTRLVACLPPKPRAA
jgi:hypothetical protein